MKRPRFIETRKTRNGFLVYYTRKLYKLNVWSVSKYGLRELERTVFHPEKPIKQGDRTPWEQVPAAIRKSITEDYKAFYPTYDQ